MINRFPKIDIFKETQWWSNLQPLSSKWKQKFKFPWSRTLAFKPKIVSRKVFYYTGDILCLFFLAIFFTLFTELHMGRPVYISSICCAHASELCCVHTYIIPHQPIMMSENTTHKVLAKELWCPISGMEASIWRLWVFGDFSSTLLYNLKKLDEEVNR